MKLTITFESAVVRKAVVLHAWEPAGRVWDILATPDEQGRFVFELAVETVDARVIKFKFRFPYEHVWEPDDLIRRITTRRVSNFWAFDESPRVMIRDPYQERQVSEVTLEMRSARRLAGAKVYAWKPHTSQAGWFDQTARDPATELSTFVIPMAGWMRDGFHYRFVTSPSEPENLREVLVWRPADGARVFLKSGQVSVRTAPLAAKQITINAIYPANLTAPPVLWLWDDFDSFTEALVAQSAGQPVPGSSRFIQAAYSAKLYAEAPYSLRIDSPPGQDKFTLPLRIGALDTGNQLQFNLLLGADKWLPRFPEKAEIKIVLRRKPDPALTGLELQVGVGAAAPYETIAATKQLDGTWQAATTALVGIKLYATPISQPAFDPRTDGLISPQRAFTLKTASPVELHTASGLAGFLIAAPASPPAAPIPAEPPPGRQRMMAIAFGAAIAGAGIFDPNEMPLGTTHVDNDIYFVVVAPHAMKLDLILISDAGVRSSFPMVHTAGQQYWWTSLPASQVPHGQRYRILQNDNLEILDPASKWAVDPAANLITNVGGGLNEAWSKYADLARLNAPFAVDNWKSQPWQSLLIYKLHASRFTVRNTGVADGFDQVTAELQPGKYLSNLAVTALEFLPLAEFDVGSWGYNPSLFFAINSSFGGPEALARCVAAAHAAGKGVSMDIVFNHYFHCPLEGLAPDVYVDGRTTWGGMVNFDNPICMQFFRQTLVYLWNTFRLDAFRFDCTLAMMIGPKTWQGVVDVAGSGGGSNFLNYLRSAVRGAADVTGRLWPYLDGENDPNMWDMTNASNGGVMDGQWAFNESYPIGDAARNNDDQSQAICGSLEIPISWGRPFSEAVRYGESQDTCGNRPNPWAPQLRIVRRAPFGQGFQMAKAIGTLVLLADGVPMVFMGQEGGEDNDFFFDFYPALDRHDPDFFARLSLYETLGDDHNRIMAWFRDLMGLRNDPSNGIRGDDHQIVGRGYKTVAFTRAYNRFFVISSTGTNDNRQTLSWLGLPSGGTYKEIFNSSWPAYSVVQEANYTNGGYWATLTADSIINIPPIGGIVLERT